MIMAAAGDCAALSAGNSVVLKPAKVTIDS
jgi:acyl-CoA reductase-like NAD-dependent aldehyde dehydrogenase